VVGTGGIVVLLVTLVVVRVVVPMIDPDQPVRSRPGR
jgi:hypothetical protein